MTIICAYTDGKHTWLGSDTIGTVHVGGSIIPVQVMDGRKWSIVDGWAYGNCGDGAVADAIRADPSLFLQLDACGPVEFTKRLRTLYGTMGMQPDYEGGREAVPHWHNSGILATAGRVWDLDACLSVRPVPVGQMAAQGSGKPWAMGAAFGLQRAMPDLSPETLIDVALDAAARFDLQIRGKWVEKL